MRSTGKAGGLCRRSRTGRIVLSALQGVHQSICGHVSALQGVPHQQYPEYHPCNFNPHSRSSDIQVPLAKQIHNRTRAKVPLTTEIPPIRRAYRRIGSENPDRGVPRRFQECGRVPNEYQNGFRRKTEKRRTPRIPTLLVAVASGTPRESRTLVVRLKVWCPNR